MMKRNNFSHIHVVWLGIIICLSFVLPAVASSTHQVTFAGLKGEKITYSIKKMGIKAGQAALEFVGPVEVSSQKFILIIFRATGVNFFDEEKIFSDPQTLLPVRVERNLNIFGSKEKIVEHYDQNPPQVRVIKTVRGKTSEMVLKNDAVIDNIYCFIYRYRLRGALPKGNNLSLNLPTQRVQIVLGDRQRIAAGGKKYEAEVIESRPSKYKVWLGVGENRIPLRIDGAVNLGPTSMIMNRYVHQ